MAGERSHSLDAQPASCHGEKSSPMSPSWSDRYGARHRLVRVKEFPAGVEPPRRVRLYRRLDHHVVQWWDRTAKRNLCERVDGDLVAAIARARQIDERLAHFRTSGGRRRLGHQELVNAYLADLRRRADAEEVDTRTVARYKATLDNHYLAFALRPDVERQFRFVASVNRKFRLAFAAFLASASVRPNGHPNTMPRPMRSQNYVMNVVRTVFRWATDPDGGNLMPEGFHNPFANRSRREGAAIDQFGEPDVTLEMASNFILNSDAYQLRLFAPMVLYGLRASEPCFLFGDDLDRHWLNVPCRPELSYFTKGRRQKRLPILSCVHQLLSHAPDRADAGLLYLRRRVLQGKENAPLRGLSATDLAAKFRRRCDAGGSVMAQDRRRIRNRIFNEAGGITYDHVVAEFRKVARQLNWPPDATVKDLRHQFATAMENGGMPEHYRKYLMGQSPGRSAIVNYIHLNQVQERFAEVVQRQLQPLVNAIDRRSSELG